MIEVLIPGTPVAKGRPRATRAGRLYTPAKTAQAEETLAARALVALAPYRSQMPLQGPLRVSLVFTMPIAASWSKKDKEAARSGALRPTGRPDLDNLVKLTTDALNEVLWGDDAQIVEMTAAKVYGDAPATLLSVTPLAAVRPLP